MAWLEQQSLRALFAFLRCGTDCIIPHRELFDSYVIQTRHDDEIIIEQTMASLACVGYRSACSRILTRNGNS